MLVVGTVGRTHSVSRYLGFRGPRKHANPLLDNHSMFLPYAKYGTDYFVRPRTLHSQKRYGRKSPI